MYQASTHRSIQPRDETPEEKSLISQMAGRPLLSDEEERQFALELSQLRSYIQSVEALRDETMDSSTATEYARQLEQLQEEYRQKRDMFFYSNIRLVLRIIAPMSRMEYMDMFQFGCMGLMRAIEKFDHTRGTAFSTHAFRWIRQAIQRGCDNEESLITLPVHIRDQIKAVRRFTVQYTQQHDEPPALDIICKALNLSYEKMAHIRMVSATPYSIYKQPKPRTMHEQPIALHESIPSTDLEPLDRIINQDTASEATTFIHMSLQKLADHTAEDGSQPYQRHAAIIRLRYRIGEVVPEGTPAQRRFREIGDMYDITPDQARQFHRIGIRWIAKEYEEALQLLR